MFLLFNVSIQQQIWHTVFICFSSAFISNNPNNGLLLTSYLTIKWLTSSPAGRATFYQMHVLCKFFEDQNPSLPLEFVFFFFLLLHNPFFTYGHNVGLLIHTYTYTYDTYWFWPIRDLSVLAFMWSSMCQYGEDSWGNLELLNYQQNYLHFGQHNLLQNSKISYHQSFFFFNKCLMRLNFKVLR